MIEPVIKRLSNDIDIAVNNDDFKSALKMMAHTNSALMHSLEEVADNTNKITHLHEKTNEQLENIQNTTHLQLLKANERMDRQDELISKTIEFFTSKLNEHEKFIEETRLQKAKITAIGWLAGIVFSISGAWIGSKIIAISELPSQVNAMINRIDKLELKK